MSFSLRSSSDRDILSRLQELVRRERSLTLSVLLHLNEIERRRLHLKQGYASIFDYCTNALGYSASAAGRRIQTARCVARFPEVYALLEANEVNLTTISEVSRLLTAASKDDLLARIRGKSQREVKAIVAEYDPRAAIPRDQVRPVVVRTPGRQLGDAQPGTDLAAAVVAAAAVAPPSSQALPAAREACEKSDYSRSGSASHLSADVPSSAAAGGPATFAVLHVIKFAASGVFMQKLGKVKSLASHRLPPNPSFEQVFELAIDCLLEKEDPEARAERRHKRGERTAVEPREIGTGPEKVKAPAPRGKSDGRSRHVAAAVRDKVFTRDEGRCTFVGPGGRRCASRHALQIDHIRPVARGGASTADNLRLLCAHHNRLEAERLMGPLSRRGNRQAPANAP